MWALYSILLLLAWNVDAQDPDLSKFIIETILQRQGSASFQTQQVPAPPAQGSSLPADGAYLWGEWGLYGHCSVTCGRGIMRRQRTCFLYEQSRRGGRSSSLQALLPLILMSSANQGSTSSMDISNVLNMLGTRQGDSQTVKAQFQSQRQIGCPGEQIGAVPCGGTMCPYPPTAGPITSMPPRHTVSLPPTAGPPTVCLSQWGPWGQCSSSCGTAIKMRMRECNCRDPNTGIESCRDMLTTSQLCGDLPPCQPVPTSKAVTSPPTQPPVIIAGSWSSWGVWSTCPSECGIGRTSRRQRSCSGSGSCYGKFQEIRKCPSVPCTPPPPVWGEWRAYGECSTTCGVGVKSRSRDCSIPGMCSGSGIETVPCALQPCPTPAPEWSQWEAYTVCSASCGKGVRSRSRRCPFEGQCPGDAVDISECENGPCPTVLPPTPEWSQWQPYGECSASCGEGTKFRQRTCPVKGNCLGNAVEAMGCVSQPCATLPPLPTWSNWSEFSECSTTCGIGARTRRRICPVPDTCLGFGEEAIPCTLNACSEPPTWETWGSYSACSKTCGVGEMTRNRNCNIPGACSGESDETMPCLQELCEAPITWGQWSAYDACTKTCGVGEKIRRRTCPVIGQCPGEANEQTTCVLQPCSTRPFWLEWGPYGACTTTCGVGLKYRRRICPIIGQCIGNSTESTLCNVLVPCPTSNPVSTWSQWSTFTDCSKTCGMGEKTRTRTCSVSGACEGLGSITIPCLVRACATTWAQWGAFSDCSTTCGVGQRSRTRECPEDGKCQGPPEETVQCGNKPCTALPPPVATWNSWSLFTPCNTTCGEGTKTRYRTCPTAGGCAGSSVEFTSCDNAECAIQPAAAQWGSWGRYSSCSATCGAGREVRFRSCPTPNACVGQGLEQRICTNEPCLACNFTAVSERQDCGFPGISRTACKERGCCYDDAQDGLIWCFFGKDRLKEVSIEDTPFEMSPNGQPDRA